MLCVTALITLSTADFPRNLAHSSFYLGAEGDD